MPAENGMEDRMETAPSSQAQHADISFVGSAQETRMNESERTHHRQKAPKIF